jgi:hypothetical protein
MVLNVFYYSRVKRALICIHSLTLKKFVIKYSLRLINIIALQDLVNQQIIIGQDYVGKENMHHDTFGRREYGCKVLSILKLITLLASSI